MRPIYGFLAVFFIAGFYTKVILGSTSIYAITNTFFLTLLAGGAIIVGRIPRKPGTGYALLIRRLVGWLLFVVEVSLLMVSLRMLLLLQTPQWVDIIGYLSILTYLTWKVLLYPHSPRFIWPKSTPPWIQPSGPTPNLVKAEHHVVRDTGAIVLQGLANRWRRLAEVPLTSAGVKPHVVRDIGAAVLCGLAKKCYPFQSR